MAQPRQALRLFHGAQSLSGSMIHANIALWNGNSAEAIRYYDEVLYNLSPGHICALLNRCMAYIDSGHPELAVMDAYRAKIAAGELREDTEIAGQHLSKVRKYIRAERMHVCANQTWTKPSESDRGNGWRSSPLASVVISATPGANVPPVGTSDPSFITSLEVRAAYRLCGALFMVGGGARMDAFVRIDDARRLRMSSWETEWFNKLGNEIMFQAMDEVDPIDPELIRRLGEDTKEKRDERMEKLVGNMRAKTTRSSYGDYPWNVFEPKLGDPDWQNHVRDWVESCTDKCSAWLIQEEESDSKLYIDLRANQDIRSGDLILSEQAVFNVTTSDPEQVEDGRLGGTLDHYYCNSCASLLVVPLQCPNEYQRSGTPVVSEISPGIPTLSPLSLSFQDPSNTIQGSSSTRISTTVHSQQSLGNLAVPPMSAPQLFRRDFMFCSSDHLVPTCSAYCRQLSKDFDIGLCDSDIEQSLRRSHLNAPGLRSVEDTKIQCLRDLLFLRAITMAINVRGNPLQIGEIIFATCGPNMRGSILDESGEMVEPWSFVSHVVRPVHYLHRLFEDTKTNQFLKLRQVDGWIVNTLLAKINRAMRVSDGPRYAKSFGADGMLADEFGPWDQRWDDLTNNHHSNNATNGKEKEKQKKNDDDNKEKSTWIASLNPLLNMIRIADPAKGEIPNVVIVQTDRVNVFAVQTEDGGVVIRAGEPLLRAKEGATEETYNGDGYAEEMEESEEVGNMEGMYDEDGDGDADGDADADANGDMDHDTTDHDADAQDSHSEDPPSDPDFLDDMLYDASPPAADHRPFAYTYTDDEALLFDRDDNEDRDDDEDGDPDGLVFSARLGEVVTRREARWLREGY